MGRQKGRSHSRISGEKKKKTFNVEIGVVAGYTFI